MRVADLDGADAVIRPRPPGVVDPTFPFAAATAHVLTAHDPGPRTLTAAENARRHRALTGELVAHPTWVTVAADGDGGHAETGVLVVGLTDGGATALGRRFDQDAVFRWTPTGWAVVPCDAGSVLEVGWALETARGSR